MRFPYVIGGLAAGVASVVVGTLTVLNFYAGKPSKLPEEPKKPAVSRTLEERVKTRHIPDEDLISLYEKLLAKSVERKEILSLSYEAKRRIGKLASESLEPFGTKQGSYFTEKPPIAYYDLNLEIPHEAPNLLSNVIAIQNPKVHMTRSGKQAFYVGFGYWADASHFSTTPNERIKDLLKYELNGYEVAYARLRSFLEPIQPTITPTDLEKLLKTKDRTIGSAVYGALLEASGKVDSPLTYDNLKRGEVALGRKIEWLHGILK